MGKAEKKAEFIEVDREIKEGQRQQTYPTEPENRIKKEEITISKCEEKDAKEIAEGMYAAFGEEFWEKKEPPSKRGPQEIRLARLANRIRPMISLPNMNFVKATLTSTGETIGLAGWMGPGNPIHSIWRSSALEFYGLIDKFGLTEEDVKEMYASVDLENWDGQFSKDDAIRAEIMKDEPHWYLAPLFTWPDYQYRGVGKRLLDWAIEQADAQEPKTPLYLEAAPYARPVYMHCGFVPCGEYNLVRRGPLEKKREE